MGDESDEVILAPFAGTSLADADVASHSFDYLVAVENGKNFGSVEKCELRYSPPECWTTQTNLQRSLNYCCRYQKNIYYLKNKKIFFPPLKKKKKKKKKKS